MVKITKILIGSAHVITDLTFNTSRDTSRMTKSLSRICPR